MYIVQGVPKKSIRYIAFHGFNMVKYFTIFNFNDSISNFKIVFRITVQNS